MTQGKAICVAGARPNFMKIAPVIAALEAKGVETVFVHTGQHFDDDMSEVFLTDLGLRQPDFFLGVGAGTHAEQTARVMTSFEPVVADLDPAIVVVVGDVNSTVGCALVTAKSASLLAHVEAGLRSRDWTMPEEINRVVTDRVSDLLLAPSEEAVANLRAEGFAEDQIHLVGNVMIDSLLRIVDHVRGGPVLAEHGLTAGTYGVVTLHRPSNVDDPAVLAGLLAALGTIGEECPLVFPVHPRTRVHLARRRVPDGLRLIDPVGYRDFVALEADARLVLTDSGGIQEETTVLGVPCLTLRENTERPVTVSEGTNQVVGVNPDAIVAAARRVLRDGVVARRPALWDGRAAERIADVVVSRLPPA